jgi:hypothetical protein
MAAAVPLMLISACARTDVSAAPGTADPSTPAATAGPLVVRVESVGGFVPATINLSRLPSVSVYADGRVITEGPVPMIYPGPALPNLQVQTITPERVQELARQGTEAGVGKTVDYGRPSIADAPSTKVTVVNAGQTRSVSVEALNEAQANGPGLTAAQRAARATLVTYVNMLQGLAAAGGMPPASAYEPEAVAVLTHDYVQSSGESPKPVETAWPGPALPGAEMGAGLGIGCLTVTGAEKDKVLAAAGKATVSTPWTLAGKKYGITFRPLLPDEKDCDALKGDR